MVVYGSVTLASQRSNDDDYSLIDTDSAEIVGKVR